VALFSLASAAAASERLEVFVVNYPLQYFAERIGGEQARVVLPAPPEVDPAFWTPSVETVLAYQDADLILLNGAGYARWVQKVSLPRARLVDTSKSFEDRFINVDAGPVHRHGPEGEHSHQELATHTWLDLEQARRQAEAVAAALIKARPKSEAYFQANLNVLRRDLASLDTALEVVAEGLRDQPLMASHPVYQYLERRYGLNVQSVHWEPDAYPSDNQWEAFSERLEGHPVSWIIWEARPDPRTVERLESMGVRSLVFRPLGNTPRQGDFLDVMEQNTANLADAF
jgi:zinc transport system substrate-binding protein